MLPGWVRFSIVVPSISIFQRYKKQSKACKAVKTEQTKQTDVDNKIRLEELKLSKAEVLKEYEAMNAQRRQEEQNAKWSKVPWSKLNSWKKRGQTWHHSTWTQKNNTNLWAADGCWTARRRLPSECKPPQHHQCSHISSSNNHMMKT